MKSTYNQICDAWLRATAITAVIGLHVLASLPSYSYTTAWFHPITIAIDQWWRFCIPLFVALSGYGLQQKYQSVPFSWSSFFQRRVFKLLPPYIGWSAVTWVVFWYLPGWRPTGTPDSFIIQLLRGQADYHLYFVPMIFQLYLLFPFLSGLVKRCPRVVLTLAGVFQLGLYWFYMQLGAVFANGQVLVTDQQQYAWGFSWLFYFVLGMCLPQIHGWLKQQRTRQLALGIITISSLVISTYLAIYNIEHGMDPIVALRFTRIPIMVYGTSTVILLTWLTLKMKRFPYLVRTVGRQSYWLYLTHTLALRVIFLF